VGLIDFIENRFKIEFMPGNRRDSLETIDSIEKVIKAKLEVPEGLSAGDLGAGTVPHFADTGSRLPEFRAPPVAAGRLRKYSKCLRFIGSARHPGDGVMTCVSRRGCAILSALRNAIF